MLKLLIVDDEKIIRETIANLINWDSIDIKMIGTAQNGIEAYNMILDEYPDIVLTDIKMPGFSGLELIEKIHELNEDTQFIILSGYGEFEYAQKAMQYGVKHYLLKPCNEQQIITCLEEVKNNYYDHLLTKKSNTSSRINNISSSIIVSMISSRLGLSDIASSEEKNTRIYESYFDIDNIPYELLYIYYLEPANQEYAFSQLNDIREKYFPGLNLYMLYVRGTLMCFFPSIVINAHTIRTYFSSLFINHSNIELDYKEEKYSNLNTMLTTLINHVKNYETLYFSDGATLIPIYNYQNILKEIQKISPDIYSEDATIGNDALQKLLSILSGIADVYLLKQQASTIILYAASKITIADMVGTTETLLKISQLTSCEEIMQLLTTQLRKMLNDYHSGQPTGTIGKKITDYVNEHIDNSELSLKWIADNYLYMNVDYISKRFLKETNMKFSKYLTEARIHKAKNYLLSDKYTIQDVAKLVGCENNPQYFSQIFKKGTGMSPSQFQKAYGK